MYIDNKKVSFNEITQVINGNVLNRVVRKYGPDYRTQYFNTSSHLLAILFFQLKDLNSFRKLQTHISNNNKLRSKGKDIQRNSIVKLLRSRGN